MANGCLFLWYGRTRLDRGDVMFTFGLNERQYQDAIAAGKIRAARVLALFTTLNRLRQDNHYAACKTCGVSLQKNHTCPQDQACRERAQTTQALLKASFLRFPEFRAGPEDVHLLARKTRVLETQARNLDANIGQLLGLNAKGTQAFLDLMPIL